MTASARSFAWAPLVLAACSAGQSDSTLSFFRRHQLALMRTGGAMMTTVGILLLTGWWTDLTAGLRQWASQFVTLI